MSKSTPKTASAESASKNALVESTHKVEGRDSRGRFLVGHAAPPNAGRPPGAISIVTKDLRRQILEGFGKRGIPEFIEDLLTESPAAAAALLSRLLPPEANDEEGAAVITDVVVTSIPQGHYVMPEDLGVSSFLYTAEEVAEVQAVQGRARERADELKRKFLGDPVPDDEQPNGAA